MASEPGYRRAFHQAPAGSNDARRLAFSRTSVSDDSDEATQATIAEMCRLIATAVHDPLLQQIAGEIKSRWANGSNDPAELSWAVFWWIKHHVKFRLDEGAMLQIGEANQQDLLIAPHVLVRMPNPSEDCDGFTMLGAALLTILGVPVVIATVAVDPSDPSRWSHVFLCAIVNGRVLPIDSSHGKAPGWMVPRGRITRFQTWKLDGTPANIQLPSYRGLHGYGLAQVPRRGAVRIAVPRMYARRGRGFGQTDCSLCDPEDDGCLSDCTTSGELLQLSPTSGIESLASGIPSSSAPVGTCGSGSTFDQGVCNSCAPGYTYSGNGICTSGSSSQSSTTSTPNYAALIGQGLQLAAADARAAIQQPQNLLNAQTWANLVGYLPIIGISVLGIVLITSLIGSKK